jgi:hypothetical protein
MTTGALIFAFNNHSVDYLAMAAWNARNIRRHLDIPVAVVTDDVGNRDRDFDCVILQSCRGDSGQRNFDDTGPVPWHNTNRVDAYRVSPWDQTLVLDADYVVASDDLRTIIDSDLEFACYRWAHDVTSQDDFATMNYFGDFRMPQWWATVIMFRKSRRSEIIFDCMTMIRDHWRHYRDLYGNRQSLYRNDHALSIALNIENGHTLNTTDIPGSIATVLPHHRVKAVDRDHYRIDYTDSQQRAKYIEIRGHDLHIMAKKQLESIIASSS